MAATSLILGRDHSYDAFVFFEPDLRASYLRLESRTSDEPHSDDIRLVQQSAAFLELLLVGAYIHEALSRRNCTLGDVTKEIASQIHDEIVAMYGLDPEQVAAEARRHLPPLTPSGLPNEQLSLEAVVRGMKSLLAACPIVHLEQIAANRRIEPVGHRCRIAYDAIRSFVLRNDESEKSQVSVVGHKYVLGALSIQEVATLLEIHPVDAVALLESHGFSRNLARLALEPDARQAIFARMRQDRIRRMGEPHPAPDDISRAVIASERIEGVDARRWIHRDTQ